MLSRMTYRKKSVSLFISIKYLHMQDLKRNRYRLNVIFWTIDNRSRAQSHFMNCEWIHFIEHSINCLVFVCLDWNLKNARLLVNYIELLDIVNNFKNKYHTVMY